MYWLLFRRGFMPMTVKFLRLWRKNKLKLRINKKDRSEVNMEEIKVLEKFDDEDIKDLFKRAYTKLSGEEGGLKKESIIVLNKLKDSFGLKESELGLEKLPDMKELKKTLPKDE